jgi:gluconokinase
VPVPARSVDPILVALDVGSSSVRALAFDHRGASLDAGVQRPYEPTTTPDGGVEIDADRLVGLTAEAVDGLRPRSDHAPVG